VEDGGGEAEVGGEEEYGKAELEAEEEAGGVDPSSKTRPQIFLEIQIKVCQMIQGYQIITKLLGVRTKLGDIIFQIFPLILQHLLLAR